MPRCGRPKRARSSFLFLTARTRTLCRSGVPSVAVAVSIGAVGEDANEADAGPLGEAVLREAGGAATVQGLGEGAGETDARIQLAGDEQPGVTGELARGWLDDERRDEQIQDLRQPVRSCRQATPSPARQRPACPATVFYLFAAGAERLPGPTTV